MTNFDFRRYGSALLLVSCLGSAACTGKIGAEDSSGANGSGGSAGSTNGANGSSGANGGSGGATASNSGGATAGDSGGANGGSGGLGSTTGVDPGNPTAMPTPYDAKTALVAVRKVKNLLLGLAPTDAEVAAVQQSGPAALQQLIGSWLTDMNTQDALRGKMVFFFRNTFQQTGFTPLDDFKPQLLENGGFDFGPFGVSAVGDDAFARLVQNLQDSFALTAWQIVNEGRSLLETLTTQKYMMTTGLLSLYLQIEMPNDQPFAFNFVPRGQTAPPILAWHTDYTGTPIALEDTLDPNSPNYMVFDDEPPASGGRTFTGGGFTTCRGTSFTDANGNPNVSRVDMKGYAQLFQRLLGYTPRYPFAATFICVEHASKPYFTTQDMSDWRWVTVTQNTSTAAGDAAYDVKPYELPKLRTMNSVALKLPRVGFYTTPAFLALWNTNDSNQHRVTANQTLLAALGQSFTSDSQLLPLNTLGIDPNHSTVGTECYGCHKNLDPMRQFWANQFDFNDRNDYPTRGFMMTAANPRPTTMGGVFAFSDVNMQGASMLDFGPLLASVHDGNDTTLNRFAASITQKLCFYANSQACDENDPQFKHAAHAFQDANFNFAVLLKELFSSPLVTGANVTVPDGDECVSISRRDHFCAALSNRLGRPDLCALAAPLPTTAQNATLKIATAVAADAFSRGSETPVTPSDPTLFYRAAVEMLCENIAPQVVDPTGGGGVYASSDVPGAIAGMVETVMGYPPSDPHNAQAAQILQDHYNSAASSGRNQQTNALRSTFVLACESPTSVSFGL